MVCPFILSRQGLLFLPCSILQVCFEVVSCFCRPSFLRRSGLQMGIPIFCLLFPEIRVSGLHWSTLSHRFIFPALTTIFQDAKKGSILSGFQHFFFRALCAKRASFMILSMYHSTKVFHMKNHILTVELGRIYLYLDGAMSTSLTFR